MNKPLKGIKILEMSHVIAAPFTGMLLGDLGAEIIKIERPGEGEYGRNAAPKMPNGSSLWYPSYNRNKKAITLDFKSEKGREVILKLIKECDIYLENFRPGLLDKMGLGYEDVNKINPNIIMVSLSGYGQKGPYLNKTAFDMTILAISGLMALTGEPDGGPMKMATSVADFIAGLYGVIGTMAALKHKDLTGEGQYVDVSMLDGILSVLETSIAEFDLLGNEPPRPGNKRAYTGPSNAFKTKDGYVYIAGFFKNHWIKLCKVIGREDLLELERFKDGPSRKKNEVELEAIIGEWCVDKTIDETLQILEEEGVPCAPVNTIERVVNDPHVDECGSIISFDYPGIGEFKMAGFPIKFSKFNTNVEMRPPTLGEHNEEVICELLGYTKQEFEEMKNNKVL